ncbi:MAG: FAD-dependent oxidoreductase [Fimbriimonadales bacterium]
MKRGWLSIGLWIALLALSYAQAVPRSVEAIPRSTERITLYWLPPHGENPAGYRVLLDGSLVAELDAAAKSYDFTGLTAGRAYRVAVEALYADGRVSQSVERVDRTYRALPSEARYPILVVGGTASGVGAAITAARMGVKVALIEPTNRLGGMITNGVAVTDVRQRDRINGLYEEFRQRVEAHYKARGDDTTVYFYRNGLNFEPWVANMLLKEMVYAEPNIDLYFGVRPTRVFKQGNRITGVEFVSLDGARRGRFFASVVIDATAEGDIAAWAGAPYRIGREPRSPEEPHAGVLYYDRLNDRFLPGSTGAGDRRIPGYAILMIVQNYPTPQVGNPPPNYNRLEYVLSPPWERSWAYLYGRIPGNKFEVNQHPHGTTLQEVNYRYPTASWEERQRIYQIYKNHVLGYLHYIQTELGQPNLGLAEDEFRDSDNLPPILYVRKARRIEGEVFLQQMDITLARERVRADSIAIGDYPMDSHAVRRVVVNEGEPVPEIAHMGEGEFWIFQYTPWYQVPYGVLVPKRVEGLLVTTCVSASHVAIGSLRMEPVRMNMGQAAGVAAVLHLQTGISLRRINPADIQRELLRRFRQYIYYFPDVTPQTRYFEAIQFLAARGYFPEERMAPEQPLTRGEAARLLWKHLRTLKPSLPEERFQGLAFTDVLFGHPYAVPVQNLFLLGVIERAENRRFNPDEPIRRRDFIRWLTRAMAILESGEWNRAVGQVAPYIDVPTDDPDYLFIAQLAERRFSPAIWDGLEAFTPEGLRFQPDAPIRRADAAQTLYLLSGRLF